LETDARLKKEMSENKTLYQSESSHLTMLYRLKQDIENFRSKAKDLGFKIGDSALISLEQDDTANDINAVMNVIVQLVNSQKEEILSMKEVNQKYEINIGKLEEANQLKEYLKDEYHNQLILLQNERKGFQDRVKKFSRWMIKHSKRALRSVTMKALLKRLIIRFSIRAEKCQASKKRFWKKSLEM